MIKFLYTLKRSLSGKNIYLWDIGKSSMWTFFSMASREIDIRGFLTDHSEYYGKTIVNRPVLSLDSVNEGSDAIIIVGDNTVPEEYEMLSEKGNCFYWWEALELNPELNGRSIYLYGLGESIWSFIKQISDKDINIKGFISEKAADGQMIMDLPVLNPLKMTYPDDIDIVCFQPATEYDVSSLDILQNTGFTGNIYIQELTRIKEQWAVEPFIMLDTAMKKGLRILFCCEDRMGRELFHRIFSLYDIPVNREVSYEGSTEDNLEDIWVLADEDPQKSVVLIHSFSMRRRYEIVEAVNDLGFSAGEHNYTATIIACYNKAVYKKILVYEKDEKVNCSIDYTPVGGQCGWAVYGDEGNADTRIMVLGGSTSSEVFYTENWISKLYKKLKLNGHNTIIYNGAHEANKVFHEMNRMIRDIHALKPDIVISLSGYNDLPFSENKFEKVKKEGVFEYWKRMERYMKLIAESEGAAFHAILQPINQTPYPRPIYDMMMYNFYGHYWGSDFYYNRRSDDFYTDLFTAFNHHNEYFTDMCHYSERGNEILADLIYEIIKGDLR